MNREDEVIPSRTYIQMYLELYKSGKYSSCYIKELEYYANILESNPELVERVVKRRIEMVQQIRRHDDTIVSGFDINEWEHEKWPVSYTIFPHNFNEPKYTDYVNYNRSDAMTPKEYGINLQRKKNKRDRWR